MDAVAPPWGTAAFVSHSSHPHRLHDQLASSDPIVSPGFTQRSAPARGYQPQQQGFDPAIPLRAFVQQQVQHETQLHIPPPQPSPPLPVASPAFDSNSFLNDLLSEQQMDNRPVEAIYAVAPAGIAQWPGLNDTSLSGTGELRPSLLQSTVLLLCLKSSQQHSLAVVL